MPKTKHDPDAVEQYLAGLPDDQRDALEQLREILKAHAPAVQERISYGSTIIFAVQRDLVGCAVQKQHLSFFTMSPPLTKTMKDTINKTHRASGATIHFSPDNPLPAALVKDILDARPKEETTR